jgi:hypothetical protein
MRLRTILISLSILWSAHFHVSSGLVIAQAKFKYVIFENKLKNYPGINHSERIVKVLMDADAFTESNLKDLFLLIQKRFVEPDRLEVWVYTNLKQVETPEEAELPKSSSAPDNYYLQHNHYAWYYKSKGNELFRYNESPPGKSLKTVIIRGIDPFSPNKQ